MLKILFALSLALLAVTVGAWVRSYDAFFVHTHKGNLVLIYFAGHGVHPRTVEQPGQPSQFVPYVEQLLVQTHVPGWVMQDARWLGLRWLRVGDTVALLVPFVYVTFVPLALSAASGWRLRRQSRRRRLGLCARCGYDLRQSTGACPECGEGTGRRATEGTASESDRAVVRAGGGDAGRERVPGPRDPGA